MRKLLVGLTLAISLTLGVAGSALATNDNASDRACAGQFASEVAREFRPLGQTVRWEAQNWHPYGHIISHLATTCEVEIPE